MEIDNSKYSSFEELVEKVRKFAAAAVKKDRFEHSERVAETAKLMCDMYGVDPQKGYLAGLAHDMCKDLDGETLLSLASHDGQPINEVEKKKPALLHGRAAAEKLRRDFFVDDKDIIQAVSRHTLGGASLCPLAKIIYAADKIEPGRPQSTPEYREKLFKLSLDNLCLTVLEENMEYLRSKGKQIAPVSFRFHEALKREIAEDANIALTFDGEF